MAPIASFELFTFSEDLSACNTSCVCPPITKPGRAAVSKNPLNCAFMNLNFVELDCCWVFHTTDDTITQVV